MVCVFPSNINPKVRLLHIVVVSLIIRELYETYGPPNAASTN